MVVSQSAPVVFLPTVLKKPSWVFAYRFYLSAVLFLFMLFLLTFHYSEVGFFVLVLLNTLFCADIFVRCAWKDLNQGQVGFALLVSVAVYAGFFYSALHTFLEHTLFSPVTELYLYVSFFLTLALWAQRNRILERERAGIYIKKIEDFLPKSARKCTGKTTRRVFAEELRPGDKILVKAGERFPCDGTITQGKTAIDEQLITGNMILAYKQKGNIVYAGTMNKSEAVYVSVEKVLAQSVLMHVMQTVQHSEQRRSIFTTDLDKSAAWMLLCLILVAGGQYAFLLYHYGVSTWLYYSSIFLLLLSLGAPLALLFCQPWPAFFAKCYAERKGIQIQNNHALEQIVQAEDVFFDKTGTLTCGQLTVECIHPLTERGRKTLLKALITAEQQVDDPFARAVMSYAKEQEITPEKINSLEMLPGVGVRAVGGKDILLAGRIQWMEEQGISLPAVIYQTEETVICVAKNGACLGYV
ncbi:MAG: cation-translocating P-type ATPase, partial [Elusimicrobiaceae bacterium]|nr:cation-translocating P-type ATPase [Elusimicrobiaceae bacterium]